MTEALPLSDRILLTVAHQRHTARSLARLFRRDVQSVHKVLGGLEDQELVARDDDPAAAIFQLADDVQVEYRPGRILVTKDGTDPRTNGEADGRCTAVTTRGTRCKMDAVDEGLCKRHGP